MRLLGLMATAIFAAVAVVARAAPLEAYAQLPNIEQLAISPDGEKLAVVVTSGVERQLIIQQVADFKVIDSVGVGDVKIRCLEWAGPENLVITQSRTAMIMEFVGGPDEYWMVGSYNLKTRKYRHLLANYRKGPRDTGPDPMNTVFDMPDVRMIDGKPVIYLTTLNTTGTQAMLSIYTEDLTRDGPRLANQGTEATHGWTIRGDGRAIGQTLYNRRSGDWVLKVRDASDAWIEAGRDNSKIRLPRMLGLGRDGRSILVVDKEGRSIREVSPTGVWSEPIADGDSGLIFDPANHNLIGVSTLAGDEASYTFFDPYDAKVWKAVLKAFSGDRVGLVSWSDNRKRIIVRVDSDEAGPAYALVDLATGQASWLGNEYQRLAPPDIAKVEPVSFKASDGLELTGYLTTPRGAQAKNLPLVVVPHGGPEARDEPGFDYMSQSVASRGYAVLRVNFRGSSGFGEDFVQAGFGQWGRKMQTDLSDGVRHLAAKGVIDPKRVCIFGGSYGGYAALAGVTLDRGVYRCAVSLSGISDLRRMANWSRWEQGPRSQRYLLQFMGVKSPGEPSLAAISPVNHVATVEAPILLIHGKDDTVVPPDQSRIMADALRAAGKPVQYVVLPGEDHWLSRGATRFQALQAAMAFIEKHNPPN